MIETKPIRTLVRGFYDQQKLRIQMGNRIVGNFKVKLGQDPGTLEEEISPEGKKILSDLRASHKKLTDGVKTFPKAHKFKSDGVISTHTELCLVDNYISLEKTEEAAKKHISDALNGYPIYTWLETVKGIGPAMAGVIISEIDIHKARHPSSLWAYAGLDVGPDGQGRSRRGEHLVDREYVDKEGEVKEKKSITFNPFLKTKLVGVLASSFLRAGDNKYSEIYRNYKNRLENHAVYGLAAEEAAKKDKPEGRNQATKLKRHNMAMRYMIKQFLIDLYTEWRTVEGLPVSLPYHEAKLGMRHGEEAA